MGAREKSPVAGVQQGLVDLFEVDPRSDLFVFGFLFDVGFFDVVHPRELFFQVFIAF